MAEYILMPKLGFNMETGQIAKWHKYEGDIVHKGDVIVEILTDKTNMEIESTLSGTLRKTLANEGETVPVIFPIAIIGEAHENIDMLIREAQAKLGREENPGGETAESSNPTTEVQTESPNIPSNSTRKLSPRAGRFARENGIDLAKLDIQGTGFQGGITARDLDTYAKQNKITPLARKIAGANNIDASGIIGTGIGGKITKVDVQSVLTNKVDASVAKHDVPEEKKVLQKISYSGMRKVIGTRLSQSKFTAPHLYFTTSVNVTNLTALRQQINASQAQKVSVNDLIVGAVTKALQKCPELNSSLQGDQILQYEDVNVGIAVALETGLIVPVLKQAQNKKITQIAKESQALIDKTRQGKLLPDEYQGGTFTVSNLGMYGIENFTAIINPPEAGILSVSAAKKIPVVIEDGGEEKIVIRLVMNITVSVDHRIIDGLVATRFLNEVKNLLENPFQIVI